MFGILLEQTDSTTEINILSIDHYLKNCELQCTSFLSVCLLHAETLLYVWNTSR